MTAIFRNDTNWVYKSYELRGKVIIKDGFARARVVDKDGNIYYEDFVSIKAPDSIGRMIDSAREMVYVCRTAVNCGHTLHEWSWLK